MTDLQAECLIAGVFALLIGTSTSNADQLDCMGERILDFLSDGESRTAEELVTHLMLTREERILAAKSIQKLCEKKLVFRAKSGGTWVYWRSDLQVKLA